MIDLKNVAETDHFIQENQLSFLYVSHPQCGVCQALLPKVKQLLGQYPEIKSAYVNTHEIPDIAGKLEIFTVPVLLLFVDGKEYMRKARFVSVDELDQELNKIYSLVME
ncbi:thioredoxin family protein [Bacillus marinisedimentorum]|uniref:thioredoxin family protein n=1 Tax=Bacillus marinisedimentorum TaxID=1821260 RepID=UPI000872A0D4|nr:thioredoxin family protein [Bacillus marinisedimentorum]